MNFDRSLRLNDSKLGGGNASVSVRLSNVGQQQHILPCNHYHHDKDDGDHEDDDEDDVVDGDGIDEVKLPMGTASSGVKSFTP